MAIQNDTLTGIVQLSDGNNAFEVSDLLQDAPVLAALAAIPASQGGTIHKYIKKTTAPTAHFRKINQGVLNAAGGSEQITIECAYFDGHFHRDVAAASGYKGGAAAYMASESEDQVHAMFAALEAAILGSYDADESDSASASLSIKGNIPSFASVPTVATLSGGMVVSAGGNGGRSVWLLRTSPKNVAVIAGNEGRVQFQYDPEKKVLIQLPDGKEYVAWLADLGGWFSVQYPSIYDIGRIANLDGTNGHTLTDRLLSRALAKFPESRRPNLIVMDGELRSQLRESRTATSPTGAEALLPTEFDGIPIIGTDHLKTDEAVVA